MNFLVFKQRLIPP